MSLPEESVACSDPPRAGREGASLFVLLSGAASLAVLSTSVRMAGLCEREPPPGVGLPAT